MLKGLLVMLALAGVFGSTTASSGEAPAPHHRRPVPVEDGCRELPPATPATCS